MQPIPKLIILGRDGILNEFREDHIKAPEEWVAVPGALEAVSRLNHAGWHAVVATNQSGIGRGMIDMAAVNAVHAHMMQRLQAHSGRIDAVFFCPHAPQDECACRKPLPGLFEQIGKRFEPCRKQSVVRDRFAKLPGIPAGQNTGSTRAAFWIGRKCVREQHALARHAIEVWSFNPRTTGRSRMTSSTPVVINNE